MLWLCLKMRMKAMFCYHADAVAQHWLPDVSRRSAHATSNIRFNRTNIIKQGLLPLSSYTVDRSSLAWPPQNTWHSCQAAPSLHISHTVGICSEYTDIWHVPLETLRLRFGWSAACRVSDRKMSTEAARRDHTSSTSAPCDSFFAVLRIQKQATSFCTRSIDKYPL